MAKKDKAAKEAPAVEEKVKKESAPEFKFGVSDLAEILEVEPASVRVKLRNAGIEKAGKSYGWNTKADLKEVADQLKETKEKPAKADKKTKAAPVEEPKKSKKDKKAK